MKRKIVFASFGAAAGVALLALGMTGAGSSQPTSRADEPEEINFALAQDETEKGAAPLVLSADEKNGANPNGTSDEGAIEELPSSALQKSDDALNLAIPDEPLDEAEMQALSRQPLFKEFANVINETAPLPNEIDVTTLDAPGAALLVPESLKEDFGAIPQKTPGELEPSLEALLNETLAVAKLDLGGRRLPASQARTLESLDAEIERLWPLWIDEEVNRNVVGRRERDWRQKDFTRFSSAESQFVDAPGADWALALDEPFWFQVVDLLSGETFYTKAGDFEATDSTGSVALLRDERRYALVIEEGRVAPTGRAMRIKILKDGRIQGVDASGKLVTDVNLGQIPLFIFQNQSRLDSRDGVFFTPTPFSGAPQRAILTPGVKIGVTQHRLALSNGKPEELFARLVVLCKSKARLVELVTGESRPNEVAASSGAELPRGIAVAADAAENGAVQTAETRGEPPIEPSPVSEPETIPTPAPASTDEDFTLQDDEELEITLPEE